MFAIHIEAIVYVAPQHSVPGLVSKFSKKLTISLVLQLKLGFQALKKKGLSSRLVSVIQFESRFFRFSVWSTVATEH